MNNIDDKISYAEDDLKKIQLKPNMYIQKFGSYGTFHLSKECIQNSIDEVTNSNSNGNKITIIYDKKIDKLIVEDNGRGIPEEDHPIDIVCTKIQSGSKFFRENGTNTSGEFGIGITCVNALSSYFKLTTYRNSYMHSIEFKDGEKVSDEKRAIKKNEIQHGTRTEFIVNPRFMGKNSTLPFDTMLEWINMMTYQIKGNIKIVVEEWDGLERVNTHKFKIKPFSDFIKEFVPNMKEISYDPVTLSAKSSIMEVINDTRLDSNNNLKVKDKKVKKDVEIEVSFVHDEHQESDYLSFCNFTQTDEGGVHVDSVEEVVCRFIQTKTKAGMTDNEKNKWDITWADIKSGLKMIINLSTSAQVQFVGNAKNKIQNQDLKPVIKDMLTDAITEYFDKNQTKLNTICKLVKLNARARIESQKVRAATKTERLDRFKEYEIPNYISCNNRGKKYKELILVEGEKSATGSIRSGRNTNTQAIFGFRGVTKNPFKCSLAEIMENKEWKNFVKVLRTGIGKEFNIDKLYFDKIILTSDADIDGYYISSGICGFMVMHMPEVIKAGKLYKVYPPLYYIDDKHNPYVNSKSDLIEIFMKKVSKVYNITLLGDEKPMDKDTLFDFLYDTMDYYDRLIELQKYFSVDKFFIERIANYLIINDIHKSNDIKKFFDSQSFVTTMMSYIQEVYPEVTLSKKNSLRGIVDGRFISIQINNRNIKKLAKFEEVFKLYGYEVKISDKKGNSPERILTIGKLMEETYNLRAKIISRFKGLGEAKGEQIGQTTLDPDNRILVQLTMEDCEKAMETFHKLQGNRKKDLELRKKMMEEYEIDPENLDN